MDIKNVYKNAVQKLKKLWLKIKSNFGVKSIIFLCVAVALILVDLLTKIYEERDDWNFIVIKGLIEVQGGIRNPGMAFSFLAEAEWGQSFLIAFTFIMLFVLAGIILMLPERFTLLKLSLYIIAAGAIGNLIDRLAYREVRDFIWLAIVDAYCNFADVWIVVGCIIAFIDILFLNEWAVFPLTKKARAAQEARREKSVENNPSAEKGAAVCPDELQDKGALKPNAADFNALNGDASGGVSAQTDAAEGGALSREEKGEDSSAGDKDTANNKNFASEQNPLSGSGKEEKND